MLPQIFANGSWHEGNLPVMGPMTHAAWLGSVVFDGARYFGRHAPDLELHCRRVTTSARLLGLEPMLTGPEIAELCWCGIRRFPPEAELYLRPMFFAETGFAEPDPESTQFVLAVHEAPLPKTPEFTACLSSFRRPARDMAPTEAKASCLYPNVGRAVHEAKARGFDTAVVRDACGNIAEFAYTNLFLVKDAVVHTPAPNGTFLNGITRQRVAALLREAGVSVIERTIPVEDLLEADEVFATGNWFKLGPCTRIEDRRFLPGPVYALARKLYMRFAQEGPTI